MMTFNIVLVSLLLPAALAAPSQYGWHTKKHHHHSHHGTVPYSVGNSSAYWPTGTGTAVYSYSTAIVSPLPVTTPVYSDYIVPSSSDADSPIDASSSSDCGPPTVTFTTSNTWTVTVGTVPSSSSSGWGSPYGNATSVWPTGTAYSTGGLNTYSPRHGYSHVSWHNTWSSSAVASSFSSSSSTASVSSHSASSSSASSVASPSSYPASSSSVISTEVAAAITASSTASSTYVAPSYASSDIVAASTTVASSTAASATITSAPSACGTGKRGLAYGMGDATYISNNFACTQVPWGYDWDSTPSGLPKGYEFVPMLKDGSPASTSTWAAAASAAISAGSGHLLAHNEPDQSHTPASDVASDYNKHMNPFKGQALLGAPAVTGGSGTADAGWGLTWLADFFNACALLDGGCDVDFIPAHWYGDSTTGSITDNYNAFAAHVNDVVTFAAGKPVWITEFMVWNADADDQVAFLQKALPFLDGLAGVARYSYFMVAPAASGQTYMISSSGGLNEIGTEYIS